jgi:rubrerythrin
LEDAMGIDIDFSKLNPQDVLDMAMQVEEEAQENYEQLARWMASDGKEEVEKFFLKMANLERLHHDQIAAQRLEMFGDSEPRRSSTWVVWEVEQPDYDDIDADVSLERAFELAMDAERRAGEYYAGALEYTSEPRVIELFKKLRDAETEHLRLLGDQRDTIFGSRDS